MAAFRACFESKCADEPGLFREALTLEKKLAAALAVGAVRRELFSTANPLLTGQITGKSGFVTPSSGRKKNGNAGFLLIEC